MALQLQAPSLEHTLVGPVLALPLCSFFPLLGPEATARPLQPVVHEGSALRALYPRLLALPGWQVFYTVRLISEQEGA